MARRASSSVNPIWLIAAAVAIAGGIGGVLMFKGSVGDPFRTLAPFPVSDYMQNSNSLRGNTYKVECVVGEQLKYLNGERLYSVEVNGELVGLVVPATLRDINIQKGQRYLFKVEVGDRGIIRAIEAKKV